MTSFSMCNISTDDEDSYLGHTIPLGLIVLLQLIVLIHSFCTEYTNRCDENFQNVSKQSRILFILLQLSGLCWTINDVFRFVIDPFTNILTRNNGIGCHITSYIPKLIGIVFYMLYLWQIQYRLNLSFDGSQFQLRWQTQRTLQALIIIACVGCPIGFTICNVSRSTCLREWKTSDLVSDSILYCDLDISPSSSYVYSAALVIAATLNIVFGLIFALNIANMLLMKHVTRKQDQENLKGLIIKQGILTLIGSISTICGYALWLFTDTSFNAIFIYLDTLIGVLVIFLLFKHNEKWFHILCKCCICCVYDGKITTLRLEQAYESASDRARASRIIPRIDFKGLEIEATIIELEISEGGNEQSNDLTPPPVPPTEPAFNSTEKPSDIPSVNPADSPTTEPTPDPSASANEPSQKYHE